MQGTLTPAPPGPTATLVLRPGRVPAGRYLIRNAGRDDSARIRDFVSALSVRTQYFRFFTAVSPLSPGLLRALTGAGGSADILIITDDSGAVVGHGMAAGAGDSTVDIGLVVADRWQGQGLGTTLLGLLTERAAGRGVDAVVLEVLPDNRRMLGIIEKRWPQARRERTPDSIRITAAQRASSPSPSTTTIRASQFPAT
jgi:ribosomal protein S18 acetylase RimI-like enzyme